MKGRLRRKYIFFPFKPSSVLWRRYLEEAEVWAAISAIQTWQAIPTRYASLPLPKKGTRRLFSPPHDFFHTLTVLHSWHNNSLFSGSDKVKRAFFELLFPPMSERNRTTRIRFLYTLSQFFSKRLSCKKNILTHTDMISLIFFSVAASSSLIFLSVSFWTLSSVSLMTSLETSLFFASFFRKSLPSRRIFLIATLPSSAFLLQP